MVHFVTDILLPFLSCPKESLHQSDICKIIKKPVSTTRRKLLILEKEGVLQKTRKGRLTLYSLNFNSTNLFNYLVMSERTKILQKDLHLREFIDEVTKKYSNDMLIFGSAAENFRSAQDIDILIIGKADVVQLMTMIKNIGKEPHILKTTYKEISAALKKEIIKKHLIITNTENMVRWLYW